MEQLPPWIGLAVIVAVPLLMTFDRGRELLTKRPASEPAWVVLSTCAVAGLVVVLGWFPIKVNPGTGVLVAVPFIQASAFVVVEKAFQSVMRRSPLSFDEARRTQLKHYWQDRLFWVVMFMSLIIVPAWLSVDLNIELPERAFR